MPQKTKTEKKPAKEKERNILADIVLLGQEISELRAKLLRLTTQKENLMQDAISQKIERLGNYKLVCKAKTTKKVDMAAIEGMLSREEFMSIAHVSLKDAATVLTAKQIEMCSKKEVSTYYKVESIHKPGGDLL